MSSTIRFIKQLGEEIAAVKAGEKLMYVVDEGRRPLTNAIFLLGCYLVLVQNLLPNQVEGRFTGINWEKTEDYRDATYEPSDFGLTLIDCWSGLYRGKQCGWVGRPSPPTNPLWGMIDVEQYERDGDPLRGCVTEVVPGRILAFRGPTDRGEAGRLAAAFEDDGVSDVVCLNDAEYDAAVFTAAGIRHHALRFEDGAGPPIAIVDAFLELAAAAEGAMAVHCKAGLGRPIALARAQQRPGPANALSYITSAPPPATARPPLHSPYPIPPAPNHHHHRSAGTRPAPGVTLITLIRPAERKANFKPSAPTPAAQRTSRIPRPLSPRRPAPGIQPEGDGKKEAAVAAMQLS